MPTSRTLRGLALLAAGAILWAVGCSGGLPRPHVILITVDTLRVDRVSLYGPAPAPTPALDRLGREGAFAETVLAPFPRTTQSSATILTGLHPLRHGADGLGAALSDKVTTLAERFADAGHRTGAFVTNLFFRPGLGFEQGFATYANPRQRWEGNSAASLTREALAWVEQAAAGEKPLFLWVHYLDPHWTYEPERSFIQQSDPSWSGPFDLFQRIDQGVLGKGEVVFQADRVLRPREIEHMQRRYTAEVAATDHAVGELLLGLERLGVLGRAIVLLTSDHGESLGEHRYWFAHGEYLYDCALHVPLLVRAPGLVPPGTRLRGLVKLEDVAPTLLDLAGLEPDGAMDGVSLAPLLRRGGEQTAPARAVVHIADHVLVHNENPRRPVAGREGRWWAIRDGSWKLIRIPLGAGRFEEELYDLSRDPGETVNVVTRAPAVAARLREQLLDRQRELLASFRAELVEATGDPEVLRSLGYVH